MLSYQSQFHDVDYKFQFTVNFNSIYSPFFVCSLPLLASNLFRTFLNCYEVYIIFEHFSLTDSLKLSFPPEKTCIFWNPLSLFLSPSLTLKPKIDDDRRGIFFLRCSTHNYYGFLE